MHCDSVFARSTAPYPSTSCGVLDEFVCSDRHRQFQGPWTRQNYPIHVLVSYPGSLEPGTDSTDRGRVAGLIEVILDLELLESGRSTNTIVFQRD